MKAFTILEGTAAPLAMINVDTDTIIPKQFLKTIDRHGLGKSLFFDLRYTVQGEERSEFILNQDLYRAAPILIVGANFGCGSSREHAVWALDDFGIRCIIAPSFADIFFNNCLKNGLLPISLDYNTVDQLMTLVQQHPETHFTIELQNQQIHYHDDESIRFEIDPFHKHCLLNGLDDIDLTLSHVTAIENFEDRQKLTSPWLWE